MKSTSYLCLGLLLVLAVSMAGVSNAADEKHFNVRQFGAAGDGKALDTKALQKAIDACAAAGGGTVRFPQGTYKAGTVYLKSNVTLHLESGATLLQSSDRKDFVEAEATSYAWHLGSVHTFLHGIGVQNVAILGPGKIDGDNKGWRKYGGRGPVSIIFENSQNILVQDISIVDSPSCPALYFGCKNVKVIRVTDLSGFCGGTTFGSCQDVLVDGVVSDGSGDDPMCIKNDSMGYTYETRPDCGYLTENIVIKNTTIRNTGHPAVKIGTGTYGVFRNIIVENCTMENTGDMFAIQLMRPKYEQTPRRTIENVVFSNITLKNVGRLLDVTSLDVSRPIIRNISFNNVTVDGLRETSSVWGLPGAPISNFSLSNIRLKGNAMPFWLKARYVHGLKLSNIHLQLGGAEPVLICENGTDLELDGVDMTAAVAEGSGGPAIMLDQVKGVSIRNTRSPAIGTFIYAKGSQTTNLSLASNDLSKAELAFDAAAEIRKEAVTPRAEDIEYANLRVSEKIKANEPFEASVTVTNTGAEGALKAEVRVDGEVAGSKWCWLDKGESRQLTLLTRRCYKPGTHQIAVGSLTATAAVEPTAAAFEFGEKMKVNSPAAAGELTVVTVPLKNIGGEEGTKEVEFYADGKLVASKSVRLAPGEEKEVTIEHTFKAPGPHKLKIGDFPVWPYATFSNTQANFYQTRNKIIIEAGGGPYDIRTPNREYGAIYLKGVKGNFVASATLLKQQITGAYAGGGLIVKNDMTKPRDDSGCVLAWQYHKYDVGRAEYPMDFRITKAGKTFAGTRNGGVSPGDADNTQDVGIFVNANSVKNELCRVEVQHFKLETPNQGK